MSDIENLRQAIAALESQRAVLGDAVVDSAVGPLRERLQALETAAAAPALEAASRELAEQRKLVTILFADLVGYTAMSEQMDAEEVRDVANLYFKRWGLAIENHAGTVDKYMGDAVLAVFGLQSASEQDPENAVRAALEMQQALSALNTGLPEGVELHMRVGIHTGAVVISAYGEGSKRSYEVIGDPVNLASRLQNLAPVDGILISHDTYYHVRGVFDVQVKEPVTVKGKRDPVQVYIVQGAKPRAFRQDLRGVEGVETRMIGREAELSQLQGAFREVVAQGDRRAVTVIGEAGIGKSRLLVEFDDWLELQTDYYYFTGRADPFGQKTPRRLLRDLLAHRFAIQESDSPAEVLDKLKTGLVEVMLPAEAVSQAGMDAILMKAQFIGWMAGFDVEDRELLREADPRQVARRGLVYLVEYLRAMGRQMPLVVILEDVHWADDSSLDLLHELDVAATGIPILVLCAARPALIERRPSWGEGLAFHTFVDLQPLSAEDSRNLVDEILKMAGNLPFELRDLIARNADGNPFYVEELVKMLIEDGVIVKKADRWLVEVHRLTSIRIPPTLVEVLQTRFDSLDEEEKTALQRAAVVGRTFWDQAIESMSDREMAEATRQAIRLDDCREVLGRLQGRELVFHRGESSFEGSQEYFFKHALLRDATYERLLRRYRRIYHGQVARWLTGAVERSGRSEEYAGLIAEHLDLAGESSQAAGWYLQAGRSAAGHYAAKEALRLLGRGLELTPSEQVLETVDLLLEKVRIFHLMAERPNQLAALEALDEWIERSSDQKEMVRRKAQAFHEWSSYYNSRGEYEAAALYSQQGANLAREAGDLVTEARCYLDLAAACRYQSEFSRAQEHYRNAQHLGQQAGLAGLEADSLFGLGVVADMKANYPEARQFLEDALRLYRLAGNLRGESRVFNSLGVLAWNQLDMADGKAYLEQSLELKRQIGDRYGQGIVLTNLGTNAQRMFEFEEALEYSKANLDISREIEDLEGEEAALGGIGACWLVMGNYEAALDSLEEALAICRQIGDRSGESILLTNLASLNIQTGKLETGFELGEQAIKLARDIQARNEEGGSWLMVGWALEGLGKAPEAELAYRQSFEIRQELGQAVHQIDALAGMARLALFLGEPEQAELHARAILQAMESSTLVGSEYPALVYLTCYRALRRGQPELAVHVLESGYQFLSDIAGKISDERLRKQYLEGVTINRELRAAWEGRS